LTAVPGLSTLWHTRGLADSFEYEVPVSYWRLGLGLAQGPSGCPYSAGRGDAWSGELLPSAIHSPARVYRASLRPDDYAAAT